MIKQIVLFGLCAVVTQVYSAPSGCINLCSEPAGGNFNNQASESLSAFQTHAAIQQNAALQNFHQNLQNQLLRGTQMSLGYTRPGNWSERDQWATDGGAGKVHEERGQLETGNAKVQYYKKNYTASFGSGGLNDGMIIGNSLLGTQNSHHQNYAQQSSNINSAVEDFGGIDMENELQSRLRELQSQMAQFNSNFHQYSLPVATTSSFESHMSQLKTRVDQVNNQIRENSQALQNSQSSSSNQNPQLQQRFQQLIQSYENRMQELRNMLDQITQQAQQTSQVSQSYHQQPNQYAESVVVPETNTHQQHYEYKSHHEQRVKSQNSYVPSTQTYVLPSDNLHQSEMQHYQQQQTYVPNDRITSRPYQQLQTHHQQSPAYQQSQGHQLSLGHQQSSQYHDNKNILRVPLHHGNRYQNYREETGSELDAVNQNVGQIVVPVGSGKHIEEHWSASGHRSESIIPQQVSTDTLASGQQRFERMRQEQLRQQQQQQRSGSSHRAYTSGGSSSVYQQSGGQLHTGIVDVGQTPDCDTETQAQYNSGYQKRYRRGIRDGYSQQTEDMTQQTEQNFQNFNQEQSGRLQHGRHHEHDHDHVNRHQAEGQETEDFYQQHQTQSQSGQLELGSQRHHESNINFDQQTDGQSRHHNNHHNHNDQDRHDHQEHGGYRYQQTQEYGDASNQGASQFEFGQQTQNYPQRPGQYSSHTENLSQQAQGFGDFTQQSSSNLEHGQHTQETVNSNENNFGSKPAPKPTGRGQRLGNYETSETEVIRPVGVKGGRRNHVQQLQQSGSDESLVVGIEDQQQNAGNKWHSEHHSGDLTSDSYQQQNVAELYSQTTGIKPNPSVTLTPLYGKDPWDIREKEDDVYLRKISPSFESSYPTDESTTNKPSFWNRVSNKLTNTYEKAKDKVSDVFG